MEESVLLVVEFDKICRLCLHSTGAMSDIFETCGETSLSELVLCATGLEVQQTDGLPSKLCHKCRFIIEMTYELQNTAAKAHSLLTKAAEQNTINCENEEKESDCHTFIETETSSSLTFVETESSTSLTFAETETSTSPTEIYDPKLVISKDTDSQDSMNNDSLKSSKSSKRKTAPKHLTCQICLTAFENEKQVAIHVDSHYEGTELASYLQLKRPYECSRCKDGIITKTQLIHHHRDHLKVNPFVCKVEGCDFVGKNQDSLRHHAVVHSSRTLVCEWCGAAFKRPWELRIHRDRHNGVRTRPTVNVAPTIRCNWRGCPKLYRSESALLAHRRAHLASRDYVCPLCHHAKYTSRSLLNRHMRMHGRARVSKCDVCSRVFSEYGQFYKHRLTEHGQWQPHRCHGCHLGYKDKSKLEKHMEGCELAIKMKPYMEAETDDQDTSMMIEEPTESELKNPVKSLTQYLI